MIEAMRQQRETFEVMYLHFSFFRNYSSKLFILRIISNELSKNIYIKLN